MNKFFLKTVKVNGVTYLKADDVIQLLLIFASTEETDVRWRMNDLVKNIKIHLK